MLPIPLLLIGILVMGAITLIQRAFPTLVPQRLLRQRWLVALNFALPMAVMTILILSSLDAFSPNPDLFKIFSEALALVLVLLSYIRFGNVFISLAVGIGALNGFLALFAMMQ
ncbi:AzlD domain-containing protein [Wohlfahrtiimonas chitiniclastica]|uniref:Branched-chain amino acid transport protein AzlD n=2 Tax=Wohlfahrtiimonas chitiniclastica TaxID=400946 RepID=L8XYT8_9GAMM|nr:MULTISPECIES: AzlD domain-containing protein [Wohlfahrtiimonas]ELV07974.1 Hypothetical protein F387_00703 [Wohlfahrtiimonas chitiniclastica SH04]KZS23847.1 hypothetical protein BMY_1717 [Wohlfahrtiimonas chitiniclastica]KZX36617.1 hypothetical protein A6V30_09515 [Wohlfahrtiimonas chitiniclastica]MBS7816518.1 AzlD domain-containing protein [Wohlfahrtiimonas chitiniclastica]MBS7818343.1 AzlD domain-containing protein [Wohlfahrtiimonas chitiniclastica]